MLYKAYKLLKLQLFRMLALAFSSPSQEFDTPFACLHHKWQEEITANIAAYKCLNILYPLVQSYKLSAM